MDTKRKIEEQDPFLDDMASHNEEFLCKVVAMKRNSDAVLVEDDYELTIKSETPFTEDYIKQSKSDTSNWEIDRKTETEEHTLVSDFGSQNEGNFLPEDPVMKYNSVREMDSKIEIKEEPWWLETENSSVCANVKDEGFPPAESSRLCMEAASDTGSGKSPLPPAEVSGKDTSFYNGKNHLEYECEKSAVTEMPTAEHVHSEQPSKCSTGGEVYTTALYLNQSCSRLSDLKRHNLIHEGKKPHQCKTCYQSFTRLSNLKAHNLIHEGKKPHQCKTCYQSFTQLSHLKTHNLIHEGKKPHQCKTCSTSFTQLSTLERHSLIHEGKKPHQCKTCNKSFTQLSTLKRHILIHEDSKAHHCTICDKSFTRLSHLKKHNLIHEGKK